MELNNLNILNVFKKKTINEKSITLLVLTLLPAMFVTSSFEATLIYVLAYVVFIILTTLLSKLISLISKDNISQVMLLVGYVVIATLIAQFINATNINFGNNLLIYIYLFPLSALPYLINADNTNRNLGFALVDALQSVLILIVVLIVTAFFRELIATGSITIGTYISKEIQLKLFNSKYGIAILKESYASLIITGFYIAILQLVLNSKKEVSE